MRLLVVTATDLEIAPFASALRAHPRHAVEILTTGVGMVATAARCARALALNGYDLALNLGLCGSFDPGLPPGTVVHVVSDLLSELGAEDGETFLALKDLNLAMDPLNFRGSDFLVNPKPPVSGALFMLPMVAGITVNTVHGHEASIAAVLARINPKVESMEGAAFMYACLLSEVPFAQVRAVSNVVEKRNRAGWKVDEAIGNLGSTALKILDTLPMDASSLLNP